MIDCEEARRRLFGEVDGDESCFWSRAHRGLVRGLARMDALPRDDPFWRGTNGIVTKYKLSRFGDAILVHDPRDVDALWAQVGIAAQFCSNDIPERAWATLHALGDFDRRWLVEYELYVHFHSGAATERYVVDLSRRHSLWEEFHSVLTELRTTAHAREWVDRVFALAANDPATFTP